MSKRATRQTRATTATDVPESHSRFWATLGKLMHSTFKTLIEPFETAFSAIKKELKATTAGLNNNTASLEAANKKIAELEEALNARPTDPIALLMSSVGQGEAKLREMNQAEAARTTKELH